MALLLSIESHQSMKKSFIGRGIFFKFLLEMLEKLLFQKLLGCFNPMLTSLLLKVSL